ncbi:glycosyltransferase family 2 protein [Jeotgalibaca sp. A122]|uniref:glycosyltransferase family 2 protein n=1 Tax=Jeotgalibaca sp. A122 TaxID=3457322 RepID=UPI003FD24C9E
MELNKKITVLMPVYNAEAYLRESIESILGQTFTDFDLLAIDDGSTDASAEIIQSFEDERVIYLNNEQNMGIVKTLNRGLDLIKSDYIVRMDSDDICLPSRFEQQVAFMDANPEVAVAGTSIKIFNDSGKTTDKIVETDSKRIRTQLLFEASIMHPTVILRNAVIQKEQYRYDARHKSTEDLGMWQKISMKYELANLPSIQLEYRDNAFGITRTSEKDMNSFDEAHIVVYRDLFKQLSLSFSDEEVRAYRGFLSRHFSFSDNEMESLANILKRIRTNLEPSKFDFDIFDEKASSFYRNNCLNKGMSYRMFKKVYTEYYSEAFKLIRKEKIKFSLQRFLQIKSRLQKEK